jgi:hypothetical protein
MTEGSRSTEYLLVLLQSCREVQASREGRYHFWNNYHSALQEGLKFVADGSRDVQVTTAGIELKHWSNMIWAKLQSLQARDKDHIERVNIASEMVS